MAETDLISRESAIVQVSKAIWDDAVAHDVKEVLKELPSVQPEPHWIPCSERLPEEKGEYLVTINNGWSTWTGTDEYIDGRFWYHGNDTVIAWQPLPEPFRKGADE